MRAGLVKDSKDYGEAVAGVALARRGLCAIWAAYADGSYRGDVAISRALQAHRSLIYVKGEAAGAMSSERVPQMLEVQDGVLPAACVLRCRVRCFTDAAILGSSEFVRGFTDIWQNERTRKYPPKVNSMRGADWGDLAVIKSLRNAAFG